MTDEDNNTHLRDRHTTIDDTIEILTAFLNAAAGAEVPHEMLVTAAHQVVDDLGAWRERLVVIVGRMD